MKAGKNQQVIRCLIDAVSNNDKDRVKSFFSEKSRFHTLRGGDVTGQHAIWDAISASGSGADRVDWEVEQLDEDESGKVFTVGTVRYLKDGNWREFPVTGAFEVCGSKVVQWNSAQR